MSDDDEAALFRAHVRDVRPLAADRVALQPAPPPPVPRHTAAERRAVLHESLHGECDGAEIETGDELLYARPGVQHGVLRRLRRGQFSVRGELDLHGLTVPLAKVALGDFLRAAQRDSLGCVRIVHGKGLRSPARQPVLKGKVALWLRRSDAVLAYCSARVVDGGTGALYVLLRRQGRT